MMFSLVASSGSLHDMAALVHHYEELNCRAEFLFDTFYEESAMHKTWTDEAQKAWQSIPGEYQEKIERNVWCPACRRATTIIEYSGEIVGQSLILRGSCARCGHRVTRVIEELIAKLER